MLSERGAKVTGIEPTLELVEEARRLHPAGRYLRAIGEEIPLPTDHFDLVVCYLVLIDIPSYRTAIEEMVAGTWAQLLNLDRVSIHDNFFTLGGHSLLATQVVARIRQMLEVELPLRAMFEAPTIAEFARRIEAIRQSGNELQVPPITKLGIFERGSGSGFARCRHPEG